jgi:tripartite-type tricarboxylate transporter receptor subunit TctC
MKRRNFLKLGAGATSIAIAGCASREGEGNYPSESISFYGYDAAFFAAAQALSQYLPEHLPNDVDIVVEQPDGWITGTANLYNAQPDGYTIGWGNLPGTLAVQKVRDSQFDMTEMSWLAHAETLVHWVLVRGDSEFNSLEDLQNADEVSFASLGGSSAEIGLIIGMNEMDVNYNTVNFSSASECIAALSRGDVDAVQFPEYGPPVMNALDGNAELLLTYREEPPEVNPDAQTVASAGYDNLIDWGPT